MCIRARLQACRQCVKKHAPSGAAFVQERPPPARFCNPTRTSESKTTEDLIHVFARWAQHSNPSHRDVSRKLGERRHPRSPLQSRCLRLLRPLQRKLDRPRGRKSLPRQRSGIHDRLAHQAIRLLLSALAYRRLCRRIIALSNLTPAQLRANADHAGLTNLFDDFVATDMNHTFKPDPRAYELGITTLHLRKDEICFAAFGGWDAYGAKRFGYTTVWVNRFDLPEEKLGTRPDLTTSKLDGLVDFILNPEHR
jgi:FMN phosphatase YigB (HAD superfamily)